MSVCHDVIIMTYDAIILTSYSGHNYVICLMSNSFTCPKSLIFFVCFRGNAMSSFYIRHLTAMFCNELMKVKFILHFLN